ncbi:MAG TPA: FimV/HubP family polar landmark protein [Casimicrobiaceae bacterium]|jgi:pilus assembly protein FimV|nr:FimV/HubP family polar landmark protein [Casimicrobiaceae bacterium]
MRAKPYITCGLLAGALTLPVSVFALGLGKLTVQSGLGQPLSATIELTSAQKDELDTLRARIADPAVYRDNNVQYPPAMSRARIVVEQTGNSAPYLRVTTSQAVNDAFLDLLVELNWATGRVVRDYTFLLDPPSGTETQAVEPTAPIRAQAGAAAAARAQAGSTAAAAAATAPAPRRSAAAAPAEGAPAAGPTYTVKRGDTLSKIAQQTKPENVSLEQMLVALFRSNENAFDERNMNRLRSGQIVTVPQADQIAAVPQSEATQVVRVQAADWRAYRDRVAGAAPATDTTAARQSASGRITTAVEDKASAAQPGKDQLRVSREAGKGAAAGTALAEDLAAKDKALRDANARVAELEKTVRDLQRAVELKNQTMSSLQASAEAAKGKAPAAPAEAPKVAASTPAATAPAPTPAPAVVVPPPAPTAAAPTVAAPTVAAPTPVTPPPEAKAPELPPPETKAPETKAEPKAVVPKAAPPKKAPTKPEPSFIDDLFGNTPTWAIGGGALVLLAGIAGIVAARRRKTTRFEDSIISGTDIKTNTVFGSTGGGVVNTGDNSLASDFSREGLGNIDTDEVDPIAEAEVYLAYGRDAQAEEILKDALKKDPQRQEIYLKLLEIHSQHNKPSAFETVASELYSVSGGQGEVWQKAMALGRQLDPANPLFTEAGGSAFAATPAAAAAAAAAEPPVSDTQVFSVPPEHKAEPRVATPLDFSLDDDISLAPSSGEEPKTPAAILAGAAQEVAKSSRPASDSMMPFEKTSGFATPASKASSDKFAPLNDSLSLEPESVPKFDLDFHLDEPVHAAPPAAQPKPAPEPERAFATAGAPAPQLARPAAAIELDKLDLAFDPDRSTFEDPTPSVLDGQWHDAATKLDLAKAYQEMGDVEGAREILQEVLHEGDDEQKTEAKTLLSKLA